MCKTDVAPLRIELVGTADAIARTAIGDPIKLRRQVAAFRAVRPSWDAMSPAEQRRYGHLTPIQLRAVLRRPIVHAPERREFAPKTRRRSSRTATRGEPDREPPPPRPTRLRRAHEKFSDALLAKLASSEFCPRECPGCLRLRDPEDFRGRRHCRSCESEKRTTRRQEARAA